MQTLTRDITSKSQEIQDLTNKTKQQENEVTHLQKSVEETEKELNNKRTELTNIKLELSQLEDIKAKLSQMENDHANELHIRERQLEVAVKRSAEFEMKFQQLSSGFVDIRDLVLTHMMMIKSLSVNVDPLIFLKTAFNNNIIFNTVSANATMKGQLNMKKDSSKTKWKLVYACVVYNMFIVYKKENEEPEIKVYLENCNVTVQIVNNTKEILLLDAKSQVIAVLQNIDVRKEVGEIWVKSLIGAITYWDNFAKKLSAANEIINAESEYQ